MAALRRFALLSRETIADGDRLLLQRCLAVSRLVRKDEPDRAHRVAGHVAHRQLDLEARAAVRHLEVGLAGVDDPHVVVIRRLADAADVRGHDRVARHPRRRDVHGDHQQPRSLRDDFVGEVLRVTLHRQFGGERRQCETENGGEHFHLRILR